jgi:hypothetical protein
VAGNGSAPAEWRSITIELAVGCPTRGFPTGARRDYTFSNPADPYLSPPEVVLDWIEKLVGISPDGGSGLTEFLIGLTLVFGLAFLFLAADLFGLRTALVRRFRRR